MGDNEPADRVVQFDTSVAHQARIYDYWLGGKDNFAADREAAEKALEMNPRIVRSVRANRAFLARAVRYLAGEAGIRQFLDIGTGLPSANNTHEVAQQTAPDSRIVYVDYDPVVLLHARSLLVSTSEGACAYVDADARDPGKILREAAGLLDFGKPVALMMLGILHVIPDEDDPYGIVAALLDAVPSGSYLVLSHPARDLDPNAQRIAAMLDTASAERRMMRDHDEIEKFFAGTELVPPGLVTASRWRPESDLQAATHTVHWAGVARKP